MSTEIKGFKVLGLQLPSSSALHYIYYKKHESKADKDNRSLFVFNLPIGCDLAVLKKFFAEVSLGASIESYCPSLLTDYPEDIWVNLSKLTSDLELTGDKPGSKIPKNCGIVTFVDKAALSLAFNNLKNITQASWPIKPFDSNYYRTKFADQILDLEKLSAEVSQSLVDFDAAEAQSIEELQAQTELVDEDGFTLVVGSHRKTKAGILGKQKLAQTVEADKAKSKLKKKEKEDFYRFQLRQRKKDEMNDLLRKFKADQEKVRLMKEKKRFRPY